MSKSRTKTRTKSRANTEGATRSNSEHPAGIDSVRPAQPNAMFRHLAPSDQPTSIHEISEALYRPFAESGSSGLKFRISGCTIDPVPIVQLGSGEYRLLNGQAVSPEYAQSLGLSELDQMEVPPPVWSSRLRREKYLQHLDGIRCQERLAEAADGRQWIIWCNHFHGTLTVHVDSEVAESEETEPVESGSIEIPFSLWGSRLVKGLDRIPPMTCSLSGRETYHLAVDDQGTITDASQITSCPETGRRLANSKLEKCGSTGHLVDPSSLTCCPVKNQQFLERLKSVCQGCFQTVDPECLSKQVCRSCRKLQKIKSLDFLSDESLNDLLSRQSWMKDSRKVRISHQPKYWLLEFQYLPHSKTTWRMVFERQSGSVCQVAKSSGWLRNWENVPKNRWPEFVEK